MRNPLRIPMKVEIDRETNEVHFSLQSACDYAWLQAEQAFSDLAQPYTEEGGVFPGKVCSACRAKLYSALIGAVVEHAIRDLVSIGVPERQATIMITDPLGTVKEILNERYPKEPARPVAKA